MRKSHRLIGMLLAAVLILSLLPNPAWAEEPVKGGEAAIRENDNIQSAESALNTNDADADVGDWLRAYDMASDAVQLGYVQTEPLAKFEEKTSSMTAVRRADEPLTDEEEQNAKDIDELIAALTDPEDPLGTQYYYYRQLTDLEKVLYLEIRENYKNNTVFSVTKSAYTSEQLWIAFRRASDALKADDPFFFTYNVDYLCTISETETFVEFTLGRRPELSTYDIAKMEAALCALVAQCNEKEDDYQKLVEYAAFLQKYVKYIMAMLIVDPGSDDIYTAKGCLVDHRAVCDGMSQATKMLCDRLGIPCLYVWGDADGDFSGHAWNLIRIGGNWYLFDGTTYTFGMDRTTFLERMYNGVLLGAEESRSDYRYRGKLGYCTHILAEPFVFPQIKETAYDYPGNLGIPDGGDGDIHFAEPEPTFLYTVNEDGETCTITAYQGPQTGTLKIPSSIDGYPVTVIGKAAFYRISGFTGNLVIPEGIREIGHGAFLGCDGFDGQLILPSTLQYIREGAFAESLGFTGSLELPEGLLGIGSYAFTYCQGFTGDLILPESLEELGQGAFSDCSGFDGIFYIPERFDFDATLIVGSEFTDIAVSDTNEKYSIIDGNLYSKDGKTLFYVPVGKSGSLVVPEGVEEIADYACFNRAIYGKMGGTLTLPSTLKRIGTRAFAGHMFTGPLVLPDGLEVIKGSAFRFSGIQTELGTYTYIGGFTGDLIIPDSVREVGGDYDDGVFAGNQFGGILKLSENLTEIPGGFVGGCDFSCDIVIPDNVVCIRSGAFGTGSSNDHNYIGRSLIIGSGVTVIEDSAFKSCGFDRVLMHCNLEMIDSYIFEFCEYLEQIEIPASVRTIKREAFLGCNKLTDVYYAGGADEWEQIDIREDNDPLLNARLHTNAVISVEDIAEPRPENLEVSVNDTVLLLGEILSIQASADYADAYEIRIWDEEESQVREMVFSESSTNGSFTFTPMCTGTYSVYITAKDGPEINSISKEFTFRVADAVQILHFDANGGSGQMEDRRAPLYTLYFLPACTFTAPEEGLIGDQWDVNGEIINAGDWFYVESTEDITVKAVWREPRTLRLVQPVEDCWVDLENYSGTNSFDAIAEGEDVHHQWQILLDGIWKDLVGETDQRLTFVMGPEHDGMQFRCVLTDKYNNTLISNAATVHIVEQGIIIVRQPQDVAGILGETVQLHIVAIGDGLTYQWRSISEPLDAPGADTDTVTIAIRESGFWVDCQITDRYGNTAYSSSALVDRLYLVSFDTDGGTPVPEPQRLRLFETVQEPEEPTREDYRFIGWYWEGILFNFDEEVFEDIRLVARWESLKEKYTIEYNANGGDNAPEAQLKIQGEDLALTNDVPYRDGFTFLGWSEDPNAEEPEYHPGDVFTKDADTTLYAVWEKEPVLVIGVTLDQSEKTLIVGESFTLTATVTPEDADDPSVTWSSDRPDIASVDENGNVTANASGTAIITVTTADGGFMDVCTVTVKAKYVISYDANGGQDEPEAQEKIQGEDLILSDWEPTRGGYFFLGWSEDSNAEEPEYHPGDVFTKDTDTTLYAVWEKEPVFVTGVTLDQHEKTLIVGENFTLTATVTPEDADDKSVDWSSDRPDIASVDENGNVMAIASGTAIITVTADGGFTDVCTVTVKAKYVISYDANGGQDEPEAQTKIQDEDLILRSVIPTREGYVFLGWAENADAAEFEYLPGDGYTKNADVTLYAVWLDHDSVPSIIVQNAAVYSGDTLTVSLSLSAPFEVKSILINELAYDKTALTLISAKWEIDEAVIADWDPNDETAVAIFENNTQLDGLILTLTFKADAEAEGDFEIGVSAVLERKIGSAEENVILNVSPGTVTIQRFVCGDTDGDGEVTSDDAIYLLRHTLNPDRYPIRQSGDVDGDGEVTSDDALYLLRHTFKPDEYPLHE